MYQHHLQREERLQEADAGGRAKGRKDGKKMMGVRKKKKGGSEEKRGRKCLSLIH